MSLESLVMANNEFGFKLLTKLMAAAPQENVFISPASISLALSMAANGADEATAVCLRKVLCLDEMTWPDVNQAHHELWQTLVQVDPQVLFAIANAIWAEPKFPFAPKFLNNVLAYYDAEIDNLAFEDDPEYAAQIINKWVEAQTHEKIKDLVNPTVLATAVMVLVNAIYFKGEWQSKFDEADTQTEEFHLEGGGTKNLPLMRQSGRYQYAERDEAQMISLPFGQGRLSMVIYLPGPSLMLAAQTAAFNAARWMKFNRQLQPIAWSPQTVSGLNEQRQYGMITLPRFQVEYNSSLLEYLEQMGFDVNSFTNMSVYSEFLFISYVLHKTFLEVNEDGAEAAAATAVVMSRSLPPPPFTMVVNRPFFCTIQDNKTGAILFIGAIYDPGEIST